MDLCSSENDSVLKVLEKNVWHWVNKWKVVHSKLMLHVKEKWSRYFAFLISLFGSLEFLPTLGGVCHHDEGHWASDMGWEVCRLWPALEKVVGKWLELINLCIVDEKHHFWSCTNLLIYTTAIRMTKLMATKQHGPYFSDIYIFSLIQNLWECNCTRNFIFNLKI